MNVKYMALQPLGPSSRAGEVYASDKTDKTKC